MTTDHGNKRVASVGFKRRPSDESIQLDPVTLIADDEDYSLSGGNAW